MNVNIVVLEHGRNLSLPKYQTEHSSGLDLVAAIEAPVHLWPRERMLIPTGIAIALPAGYEAQIRPRSGFAHKHGITILNAPGTVDADYRGEIKVLLINHSEHVFTIRRGERIAQLVVAPYTRVNLVECDALDDTSRGQGGFGSTGI